LSVDGFAYGIRKMRKLLRVVHSVSDIIHTDGGLLGIPWNLGHVDFYPNNGVALQPGCVQEELSKNNILGIVIGCR
jgi:hypothetical protein